VPQLDPVRAKRYSPTPNCNKGFLIAQTLNRIKRAYGLEKFDTRPEACGC